MLNKALVGGSILSVALARFPRSGSAGPGVDEDCSESQPLKVCGGVKLSVEEVKMILGLCKDSAGFGCPAMVLFPETHVVGCLGGAVIGEEV